MMLTAIDTGGILLYTEGNLEMYNEDLTAQDRVYGDGAPGQSWLARATFGTMTYSFLLYVFTDR